MSSSSEWSLGDFVGQMKIAEPAAVYVAKMKEHTMYGTPHKLRIKKSGIFELGR